MKKILLIVMLIGLFAAQSEAQKQYKFGTRTSVELSSAVAVTITPVNTLTVYTIEADTNVTFNAVVTKSVIGDRIIISATADASARTMSFGTSMNGANDTITATKTMTYEFIYTGSTFDIVSKLQSD